MFSGRTIILSVILFSVATVCYAEIYKYKDADGKWQFTDTPPAEKNSKVEVIQTDEGSSSNQSTRSKRPKDLAKSLKQNYPSNTPVERATLAVVSIKTPLGGGTGFFVSKDGYIVTNRHVVRPTTTAQWEKSNEQYQKNVDELASQKENIERRQKELKSMSTQLERYKKRIDEDTSNIKSIAHSDYRVYKNRYHDFKAGLKKAVKTYEKNKKLVEKQKADFNFSSTLSRTKRRFKIQLKDNSILQADLISLSKEFDLALLKLNGHTTPFIDTRNVASPSQGSKSYAVGSPLGLRDFVTYGIITKVNKHKIITDTQILPGNSGGPLIDTQGKIIGVNTQKLMADKSIGSAGFGVAIPIRVVNSEFGEIFGQ